MSRILIAALLLMGAVIASAVSESCWDIPATCITPGGNGGLPCPEIVHYQEGPSGNLLQDPPGVNGFCVGPGVTGSTLPTCALATTSITGAICDGSSCCHPSKSQIIPRCPFSLGSAYFTTTGTKKVGLLSGAGAGAGAMPWSLEADKPNIAYAAAHNIASRQPPVTLDNEPWFCSTGCVRTVPVSTTPCDVDSGFCPCTWTGIKCSGLALTNPASTAACASNIYMYMVDGNGEKRALQMQGGATAGTPQIADTSPASCSSSLKTRFCAPSIAPNGVASIDTSSKPVTIKVHNGTSLVWQCQLGVLSAAISDRAYLGCVVPAS